MKFKLVLLLSVVGLVCFSQDKEKIGAPLMLVNEPPNLKKLGLVIENEPDNLSKHSEYLNEFDHVHHNLKEIELQFLTNKYNVWIKRFPKSANVPFSLGKYLYRIESPKAKNYLLKTVEINPNLAQAWHMLYVDALRWGDSILACTYLLKAVKNDPKNADYALSYALLNTGKVNSDSLLLDVALKFPENNSGAYALSELANNTENGAKKKAYYEQLFKWFSTSELVSFKTGMSNYFNYLINSNSPELAFELALNMVFIIKKNTLEWKHKYRVAKDFIELKKLMASKKYEMAVQLIDKIKLRDDFSLSIVNAAEKIVLDRAEIEDLAEHTQTAYDSIVVNYSKWPTEKLRIAMLRYAVKLGKDSITVHREIRQMRTIRSVPATAFSLFDYKTKQIVSLNNFKGKVILLTFWFPGCSPCRQEFPHFENVLKKFKKYQIAYLGINGISEQDDYVIPFLDKTEYSFTALKNDKKWDQGNLTSWGYPSNYLIDQNGRIMFSKFYIDKNNEKSLELMITELLNILKL